MVEFALVLPILLTLVFGIIDFGWIFGNQLIANNACREAARYTAVHYYDSASDDDRINAENIILDRAPTLASPNVQLVKSGDKVTISFDCNITVLTPFLSALLGEEYNVKAKTVMRLE